MMKILDVRQLGEVDPLPLLQFRYDKQRALFRERYNVILPEKDCIPFSIEQLWRAFQQPVSFEIDSDDGYTYCLDIDAGFIMDFASIPLWLRGKRPWYLGFTVKFPDNDDERMVIPSTVHDACFAFKLFDKTRYGFELANELFRALCVYYGVDERAARWLYRGVSSKVGWKIYQEGRSHDRPQRARMHKKKTEVTQ